MCLLLLTCCFNSGEASKSSSEVFSLRLAMGLGAKDFATCNFAATGGGGTKGLTSPSYLTSATYPVTSSARYLKYVKSILKSYAFHY